MWVLSKKYRKHFQNSWLQAKKRTKRAGWMNVPFLTLLEILERFFETTKIWTQSNIISLVETKGIDLIQEAIKQGKGLICLTPHLGSFELAPRVVSEFMPLTVMYRPPKREDLNELLVYFRDSQNVNMVKTNYAGVKSHKILKVEIGIGILPDQVPDRGAGSGLFFCKASIH